MKRFAAILLTLLMIAGCSNRNRNNTNAQETLESNKSSYSDIVDFITKGYQCGWEGMDFYEMGSLSMAYLSCSSDYGYAEFDINGDGVKELVLGKSEDNGTYKIFDIWTTDTVNGQLVHLANGDDRDWFVINGDGVIIESIVDLRMNVEKVQKGWQIEGAERVKIKGDGWNDSLLIVPFTLFSDLVEKDPLAGGYTSMRTLSEDEFEMFKKATDDDNLIIYTPLYVSTQVVAGTNYKIWCIWDDLRSELKDFKKPTKTYGYCWITIFKPLPGQGEPRVTSIEIERPVYEVAPLDVKTTGK